MDQSIALSSRMTNENHAIVMGGVPQTNLALFHKVRFAVGDRVDTGDLLVALEHHEDAGS